MADQELRVNITADSSDFTKATNDAASSLQDLKTDVGSLDAETVDITVDADATAAQQELGNLQAETDNLDQQTIEITADMELSRIDRDLANLDKVLDGLERRKAEPDVGLDLTQLLRDEAKVRKAITDLSSRRVVVSADMSGVTDDVETLGGTGVGSLAAVAGGFAAVGAAGTKMTHQGIYLDDVSNQALRSQNSLLSLVGVLDKFRGAFLGAGAAVAAWNLVGMAADVETTKLSLEALTGSAEAGAAAFEELQHFAATTPFEMDQVTSAAKSFLAAGLDMDTIPDVLTDVGNAASALNAPLDEVAVILGQMYLKGKVTTEELQQLSERGIPGFDALAGAMGITTAELQKLATEGKLGREEIDLLIESLGDMFPTSMAQQADSFNGRMSTLNDTFGQLGVAVGNVFLPVLKDSVSVLTDVAEAAIPLVEAFGDLPGVVKATVIGFGGIVALRKTVGPLFSGLTTSLQNFRAEMGTTAGATGKFKGAIRGIAGAFSPWTIALTGGITVLASIVDAHADAAAKIDELANSIDAASGKVDQAGLEAIADDLVPIVENARDAGVELEDLGITLGDLAAIATGDEDALKRVQDALGEIVKDGTTYTRVGRDIKTTMTDEAEAANQLQFDILELAGTYLSAKEKAEIMAAAQKAVGTEGEGAATGIGKMAGAAADGVSDLSKLNTELEKLLDNYSTLKGDALTIEEAVVAQQEGFEGLGESVKENGTSLDQYTAKGAENRLAIGEIIKSQDALRVATFKETGSRREANKAYRLGMRDLEDYLISLGFAKDDIAAFVKEVKKTPRQQKIQIATIVNDEELVKLQKRIDRQKDKKVRIEAIPPDPSDPANRFLLSDSTEARATVGVDIKLKGYEKEKERLQNLSGDALIHAYVPKLDRNKVTNDINGIGGDIKDIVIPVEAKEEDVTETDKTLDELQKPGGKDRHVVLVPGLDPKYLDDVRRITNRLAADRDMTIYVHTVEVDGDSRSGGGGRGNRSAPIAPPAPNPLAGLRAAGAALLASPAQPWFSPAAQAQATQQGIGGRTAPTGGVTQLAPKSVPVRVYLDGEEIGDRVVSRVASRFTPAGRGRRTA